MSPRQDDRAEAEAALSRELLFLLDVVAAGLRKQPVPQAPAGLDHDRLSNLIAFHKLQLGIHGPIGLPAAEETAVTALRKAAAAHVLVGAQELAALARAFETAGIELLALKGATLSDQLYGTPAGRYYGDIDILVRPRDAARALQLLNASGYGVGEGMFEQQPNAIFLRADGRRLPIELHTQLAEYRALFTLGTDEAFAASATGTIAGQKIRTLDLETAIAYAAFHGARHHWSRLGWLVDIAAAASLPHVQWPRVAAIAKATGTERHLAFAMALTRTLLGIAPDVPAEMFGDHHARLRRARDLTLELVSHPAPRGGADPVRSASIALRSTRADLALHSHPLAKAAAMLSGLEALVRPTAADRTVLRLPARLDFLYYPVRPFRIASAAIRRHSARRADRSPQ